MLSQFTPTLIILALIDQSRGKALGIPINKTWWMKSQLLMHGHVLAISSKQLNHVIEARHDFVASGGSGSKGRENEDGAITIQLALRNTNPNGKWVPLHSHLSLAAVSPFILPHKSWIPLMCPVRTCQPTDTPRFLVCCTYQKMFSMLGTL